MPDESDTPHAGSSKGFRTKAKKFLVGDFQGISQSPSLASPRVPLTQHTQTSQLGEPEVPLNASADADADAQPTIQDEASTRDLWHAAFESLTMDEKSALEPSTDFPDRNGSAVSLVDNIINLTTEKSAEYGKRGWNIKRKGHEDINVRDKAKSLMVSVLNFKDLIDAGLKFDVSGYGATAWSVISFGLKLAQNDKDRMDAIFDASGFLAEMLARYANIEAHYRDLGSSQLEHFEEGIVGVYVAVLQYAGKVMLSQRAGRVLESLASLTGQPLQLLKERINSKDGETKNWRKLIEHQYRLKEHGEISKSVDDLLSKASQLGNSLTAINRAVLSAEELEILEWFSPVNFFEKHDRLRKELQESNPNSGQWFLTSATFFDWKFFPQSFLWLYGQSGSGKSCLCSTIIENLNTLCLEDKSKVIAYWYFDLNNSALNDVNNMLRSLIRQLSAGVDNFPITVRKLSDIHRKRGSHPSTDELMVALHAVITNLDSDVFLVLDALDEFPEDVRHHKRTALLRVIEMIVKHGHHNLHLLVTSRPETDIRTDLRYSSNPPVELNVEEPLSIDLELFFDNIMQMSTALKNLGECTKNEIRDRLITDKQRRFRLAALQLDELQLCRGNEEQVRRALNSIPDTIEAIYSQVLDNINKYDIEPARSIFRWLWVSKRPLRLEEVAKAAGLSNMADVMRICTSNLLTSSIEQLDYDGEKRECEIIRFAHSSVTQYLLSINSQSSPEKALRFYLSTDQAHSYVSLRCLDYLHEQNDALRSTRQLLTVPLLHYAARYWHVHFRIIRAAIVDREDLASVERKVYELFGPAFLNSFINWLRLANPDHYDQPIRPEKSPELYPGSLYYAVLLEFEDIAHGLIEDNPDLNVTGGGEGNVLRLAAHRGYISIVRHLLEKGADVNLTNEPHTSALYSASIQGHEIVVDILLQAGADFNKQEGYYGNALQATAYLGDYQIFDRLLYEGADVNAKGGIYGTALEAACVAGHSKIVLVLLRRGADPNCQGGLLKSPLQAAITGRDTEIVRELLESGAKSRPKGGMLWQDAYLRLRRENETMMKGFEDMLVSYQEIPPELIAEHRLLAGVLMRPKTNASNFLLEVPQWASTSRGNERYEDVQNLIQRMNDLDAANDDPEQFGYLFNRLSWAVLRQKADSMLYASLQEPEINIKEPVFLLLLMMTIAARVNQYEAIAFQGERQDLLQLRETALKLCTKLLKIALNSDDSLVAANNEVVHVPAEHYSKTVIEDFDAVTQLDTVCQQQMAMINNTNMAAALQRVLRIEAEMEGRIKAEVVKQVETKLRDAIRSDFQEMNKRLPEIIRQVLSSSSDITNRRSEPDSQAEECDSERS